MRSELHIGDKLSQPGKPENHLEVLDTRVRTGSIHVFDSEKREARYVDIERVKAMISEGTLVLTRKGMPRVSIEAQYDNPKLLSRVRLLHDALGRINVIRERRGISFDASIPLARAAYEADSATRLLTEPFPSRATLHRAHKSQSLGLPVLRGDANKGNTTPRYSKAIIEFVQDALKDHYLKTESKWTLFDLTSFVNREARRRGLHSAPQAISRKFVQSVLRELTVDAHYDRMDPLDRVAGKSFAKKRIRAAFPFARIEQDALHLPFVVTMPDGIARIVYVVLAIDVCTGYPVGWHFVVGQPREMDSLLCLEMYLTPAKAARFKELGITHEMNLYGTPVLVVFDNGPETKGNRIVRLQDLEIDVKHCRAKEAQGKPFIERLNRSLKEALQRLPGCTRFNGKDGERDPVALGDELMTLDELEKWVVRWLFEDWVNTPLDRLRWDELLVDSVKGKTPLERIKYQIEELEHPIGMAPSRQQWVTTLFEHKRCTLSAKTGITLEGLSYRNENMSYLLAKYGDHAQLHIVYNPDDFRQVYVYEGEDMPLVALTHEHVRPDTPAWTFNEAKERLAAGMLDWTMSEEKLQFMAAIDKAATGSGKPKQKRRSKREENKETARLAKETSAIQRTINRPLSNAAPFGPAPLTNPSLRSEDAKAHDIAYDDLPLMNIVNRKTGEKLL